MNPSHATITSCSAVLALVNEYMGKVIITAQADYDCWPEARAMRSNLMELGAKIGISPAEVDADLKHAPINRAFAPDYSDGGRW